MNNLFFNKDGLTMNEKYDIKGSWVARNAEPPLEGQSLTCSYCEQKFIYQKRKKTHRRMSISKSLRESSNSMSGKEGIETILKDLKKSANISQMYISDSDSADIVEEGGAGHGGEGHGKEKESKEKNGESYDSTQCPYTVNGEHEPNIILKDNDIKYKIRLPPETTAHLLTRIRSDAEFLYSLGIMDYSLLVGVHNTEYSVRLDTIVTGDGAGNQQLVAVRPNGPSFTPFQVTKASEIAISSSTGAVMKASSMSQRSLEGASMEQSADVRHRTESNMSVNSTGTIEYIQRSTGQSEAHLVAQSIVSAMTAGPRASQGIDGMRNTASLDHPYLRGDAFDEADLSLTRKLDVSVILIPRCDPLFKQYLGIQSGWS
jgi:hypothetical protein